MSDLGKIISGNRVSMFSQVESSRLIHLNLARAPVKQAFARLFMFLGWTMVFAVIYAQSPLFTSNQNQYFLHGLANANFRFLKDDWLANTLDPTPLFSLLVSLTFSIFHSDFLFYVYYAILLGIYLYSLSGTGSLLFELNHPTIRMMYLALLLMIHSAGMRFFLSRAIGPDWAYLLEGGLAGQRVLGVVFQPSTFGVLLVLSIFLFYKGYDYLSILPLGLAVSFHPTYLLSAGMIALAYTVASFRETQSWIKSVSIGLLALLFVSPTLIYVYQAFGSTHPETTALARDILVYFRIPHHAVISEWFDINSLLQICFILVAMYLVRRTRLFVVIAVSSLLAALLTVLQVSTQNEALALLFPWRISTILVPISVAIMAGAVVWRLFDRISILDNGRRPGLLLASASLILLTMLVGFARTILEREMIQTSKERDLMLHVRAKVNPGDVYLIPTKMQDFRLETGAPIYIDFKSIPYQDAEILEWYRRMLFADRFYEQRVIDCLMVESFAAEGVTHVVFALDRLSGPCDSMRLEYQDEYYGLYSIRR